MIFNYAYISIKSHVRASDKVDHIKNFNRTPLPTIPIRIVTQTEGLKSVPDDTSIARYFTREKLELLLKEQSLWFANSDTFSDKKERTIPEGFYGDRFKPEQKESYQKVHVLTDKLVKTYISCWTEFDAENYALWNIYDLESSGVCLIANHGLSSPAARGFRATCTRK